jgi:ferredoxin-NADP reductase
LPSYRIRHYSLRGDPAARSAYTVAVLRAGTGRGGSIEIYDALSVGTELAVRGPRNNFELVEAPRYLFRLRDGQPETVLPWLASEPLTLNVVTI